MDLKQIDERLSRIEGKLDDHLKTSTRAETDISWLKKGVTALFILMTGVLGKLIHTSFLK